jgi:hypothetical protein
MKGKKSLFGLGVIALSLMVLAGCADPNGGDDGGGDGGGSPVNGTWVKDNSKLVLNNGSYTWWEGNTPQERGNYSISGGNITTNTVDVYFNNTWLNQAQAIATGNYTADDFLPYNGTYVLSNNNETLTISFWGTWIKSQ